MIHRDRTLARSKTCIIEELMPSGKGFVLGDASKTALVQERN